MARVKILKNQFTAGELTPRMLARPDMAQYAQGLKRLENLLPMPHGGVTNRPGMRFVAAAKNPAKKTRVIPFAFNVEQTYVIELGDLYLRFYRDRGQIVDELVTNGTFTTDISGWTDLSTGADSIGHDTGTQRLALIGAAGETAQAEQAVTISSPSSPHRLAVQVFAGTVTLTVGTSSGASDIQGPTSLGPGSHELTFTPGAALIYLGFGHGDGATRTIDSVSLFVTPHEIAAPYTEAELFEIQFVQDADTLYLAHPNHKPATLTRSGHTNWTLASYTPLGDPFTATDNYPACVAFFQGRIAWAATNTKPQTIWFSKSGDFNNLTAGTGAADGFNKTLAASQVNVIRWLVGGSEFLVGTTGGEWIVDKPASAAVDVGNFSIRRIDTAGVAYQAPAEVDNQVLFLQRNGQPSCTGRRLLQLRFDIAEDSIFATNLTLLAEHVTGDGIDDMAWAPISFDGDYQGVPVPGVDRLLWCVRADGQLLSFTFNPRELVIAWARHVTVGAVESVTVIPGLRGDEVWLVVDRDAGAGGQRTVEFLDPDLFLDSALSGDFEAAVSAVSGLDHLDGRTVQVLADDSPATPKLVSGGAITLDGPAQRVQVGLGFEPLLETMPIAPLLQDGHTVGARKNIGVVALSLLNSVGVTVSGSDATGTELPFRDVGDDLSAAVLPFTGIRRLSPPAGWRDDATLRVRQTNPLPLTVLALTVEAEANS